MFTKPIVCVALACASVSHAVRRDFKLDKPLGLVDGLSALIQKHAAPAGVQSAMQILQKAQKAVQGITPGAKEAMDVALRSVISEIEDNVQTKIIADHRATQTAIDAALGSLTSTTNAAVGTKAAADTADTTYVDCRGVEQTRLQEFEGAQAALAAATAAQVAPCAEQDAAAPFSKEFAEEDLVFECNIADAGNCDGPLADFEKKVDGLLSDLEQEVSASTVVFEDAKRRCDAANAAIVAAERAQAIAQDAFQAQKEECMRNHETRQVSACVFGMDLTNKCSSKSDFQALDAQIDGSGSVRSESDRMSEWEATAVTKCMLNLIVEAEDLTSVDINEKSLAACTAAVNFAENVGVLDRKVDEFAALTTPAKFTCAETEITFSGFTWEVPDATEDGVVTSSDYQKVSFDVPVNKASGATFDFCAVDAVTCGFFQCPRGKVIDASKTCQLSSGCTVAECCP